MKKFETESKLFRDTQFIEN